MPYRITRNNLALSQADRVELLVGGEAPVFTKGRPWRKTRKEVEGWGNQKWPLLKDGEDTNLVVVESKSDGTSKVEKAEHHLTSLLEGDVFPASLLDYPATSCKGLLDRANGWGKWASTLPLWVVDLNRMDTPPFPAALSNLGSVGLHQQVAVFKNREDSTLLCLDSDFRVKRLSNGEDSERPYWPVNRPRLCYEQHKPNVLGWLYGHGYEPYRLRQYINVRGLGNGTQTLIVDWSGHGLEHLADDPSILWAPQAEEYRRLSGAIPGPDILNTDHLRTLEGLQRMPSLLWPEPILRNLESRLGLEPLEDRLRAQATVCHAWKERAEERAANIRRNLEERNASRRRSLEVVFEGRGSTSFPRHISPEDIAEAQEVLRRRTQLAEENIDPEQRQRVLEHAREMARRISFGLGAAADTLFRTAAEAATRFERMVAELTEALVRPLQSLDTYFPFDRQIEQRVGGFRLLLERRASDPLDVLSINLRYSSPGQQNFAITRHIEGVFSATQIVCSFQTLCLTIREMTTKLCKALYEAGIAIELVRQNHYQAERVLSRDALTETEERWRGFIGIDLATGPDRVGLSPPRPAFEAPEEDEQLP